MCDPSGRGGVGPHPPVYIGLRTVPTGFGLPSARCPVRSEKRYAVQFNYWIDPVDLKEEKTDNGSQRATCPSNERQADTTDAQREPYSQTSLLISREPNPVTPPLVRRPATRKATACPPTNHASSSTGTPARCSRSVRFLILPLQSSPEAKTAACRSTSVVSSASQNHGMPRDSASAG